MNIEIYTFYIEEIFPHTFHTFRGMLETNQFLVPIDLYTFSSSFIWKSVGTSNCLATSILQNIFLYARQKKETQTGLEQVKSE